MNIRPSVLMTACWNCKTVGKFKFIKELKRAWAFECNVCGKKNIVDK